MGHLAFSIDDQIKRLSNKGLDLSCYDEQKLKEILLDIGYYRLGFYSYYFINHKKDKFFPNIKISEIVDVYYMDIDLKYLLLKYINRIELNFRTKVIYYPSMKYKDNAIWYMDSSVMDKKFIARFADTYTDKFKQDNLTIKKHHQNYPADKYAPAWKTFEYLSFGSILTIFNSIKDETIKKLISNLYHVDDIEKFVRFMHTIRQIRNIRAHSGVLFDFSLPQSVNSHPKINYNGNDRNSIDASIKVIAFLLESFSLSRLADFRSDIYTFFEKHKVKPHLDNIIKRNIKYLD